MLLNIQVELGPTVQLALGTSMAATAQIAPPGVNAITVLKGADVFP